jgi:hypothetical protein
MGEFTRTFEAVLQKMLQTPFWVAPKNGENVLMSKTQRAKI